MVGVQFVEEQNLALHQFPRDCPRFKGKQPRVDDAKLHRAVRVGSNLRAVGGEQNPAVRRRRSGEGAVQRFAGGLGASQVLSHMADLLNQRAQVVLAMGVAPQQVQGFVQQFLPHLRLIA